MCIMFCFNSFRTKNDENKDASQALNRMQRDSQKV